MKGLINKMTATALVAAMLLTSGAVFATETNPTPGKEVVSEAPDGIRKEMKGSGYQLVKVNGNFKVYLSEGDRQKIVVEGDECLVPGAKHIIGDNSLH